MSFSSIPGDHQHLPRAPSDLDSNKSTQLRRGFPFPLFGTLWPLSVAFLSDSVPVVRPCAQGDTIKSHVSYPRKGVFLLRRLLWVASPDQMLASWCSERDSLEADNWSNHVLPRPDTELAAN